jgi:hypothetical protein
LIIRRNNVDHGSSGQEGFHRGGRREEDLELLKEGPKLKVKAMRRTDHLITSRNLFPSHLSLSYF